MAAINMTVSINETSLPLIHTSPPTLAVMIFVGVNTFICIAGTSVNLITMATILKHDGKKLSVQNLLVLNFCLSNLLFCFIAGDTSRRMLTSPFLNPHLCRFRAYSLYVFMCSSVYSLLLISYNRYFIILFPQSRHGFTSLEKTAVIIVLEWLICVILMLPPLTGIWGQLGFEQATKACTLIREKSSSFSSFFQIVNFIAPLVIQVYCYGHIFIAVRRQNRKMLKSACSGNQQLSPNHGLYGKRRRQEWKLTLLTFAIILTYIVCFLPYTVSSLSDLIHTPFHTFAVAFLWMHLVVNPLIYTVGDSKLRHTLKVMLHCKTPDEQPSEPLTSA